MKLSRPWIWALWLALFALVTVAMARLIQRPDVRVAHGVVVYLLLIVGASRQGGRSLSMVMVIIGFLAVDFLFVPPRRSFGAASELDWLLLAGFALTGFLISELFSAQQRAVQLAKEQAEEVARLSAERLQLEREASAARVFRETDRLKNALLTSIAHDLRSPVATLMLLGDPAAPISTTVALERVSQVAARLGRFLHSLQRFATSGDAATVSLERYDVSVLVQTALRSADATLGGRRVDFTSPPALVWAACDLTLTVSILENLLQNAARHAPSDSPIDIVVHEGPERIELVVADRGPGVDRALVDQLFTAIPRGLPDPDDRGASARLGVGLSIARTFARAQDGDLVYRARRGGGAEFALQLRRAGADAPMAAASPNAHDTD